MTSKKDLPSPSNQLLHSQPKEKAELPSPQKKTTALPLFYQIVFALNNYLPAIV
jgi:hypothetical protein